MQATTLILTAAVASASELVINTGTQTGSFLIGHDIGPLNPHDYRPNEFVSNDFVFEGLTAWDGEHTAGVDGIAGNEDDFVAPSLAASWTTNYAAYAAAPSTTKYEITFALRPGVTFHDGSPWDAAACKANFDQIMGGTGEEGAKMVLRGMHDWMGFTQSLSGWSAVDDMTFKLSFNAYYEAALRELAFIRPFRMISVASLPLLANNEISHARYKKGAPWVFKGYKMVGVGTPLGTGPYKVVHKVLGRAGSTGTYTLPAADFNATCFVEDDCSIGYANLNCGGGACEHVVEVKFEKFAGHWKAPSYDSVILRAYESLTAVKEALNAGTLHVAYGVQTLAPSAFLSLATAEEGSSVEAHKAPTDLNTRLVVLNSGGALDTKEKRKLVMGILDAARSDLYGGELAEEEPMDTIFDPTLPHCSVLSSLSTPAVLAATRSPSVTATSIATPLRFMYIKDIAHHKMIAAWVIATLYTAGFPVEAMPVDKETYNTRHCDYLADPEFFGPNLGVDDGNSSTVDQKHYYGAYYNYGAYGEDVNYHSWDIAISETWGPPYDATSKLWDMTHGPSGGWCSKEADAAAIKNMEDYPITEFLNKVRGPCEGAADMNMCTRSGGMSNVVDPVAREAVYTEVLTALHDEAIFLPLTAKRQTAVTSTSVSGFKFGFMEFDMPLANLYPTAPLSPPPPLPRLPPPASDDASDDDDAAMIGGIVGGVLGGVLLLVLIFTCYLIMREKKGQPMFHNLVVTAKSPPA